MFQLDVDAVESGKLRGDLLDMLIGEPPDPLVRTAEQVLVKVEHVKVSIGPQLHLERPGETGDSAKFVIRADNGELRTRREDSKKAAVHQDLILRTMFEE